MKRKAEGENARARTRVRNQLFFSPPTPRFAHTGERDCGKHEEEKTSVEGNGDVIEDHQLDPFPRILKPSG
jgi:hypothetical protein